MKMNKKFIALALAGCLTLGVTGIVFADNISNVISAIINKVVIILDSTGNSNTNEAGQQMSNSAADAKQRVDGIINNVNSDIDKQLEEYKNSQLDKKNQEINNMITQLQKEVSQKKQEKLNQYKQKIDEKINSEYDKLIKDLMK